MEEIKEVPLITQAETMAKRIEDANKKAEDLIKSHEDKLNEKIKAAEDKVRQMEDLFTKRILAGKSEAGIQPKIVNKEDADKERINNWLKGTGLKI